MSKIPNWLVEQYNRAKQNGWIESFKLAANQYKFLVEDVMGIASRESNMKNIAGDFHDGKAHGFSLMQLDIGSHKAWIESGAWKDANKAIYKGVEALAAKRDIIVKASKQSSAVIKFRSGKTVRFTPKPFNDAQLRQMTLASYNSGMAAYYHFSLGHSIDAGTTGKNYSGDVLKRSQDFKDLMARDNFGATANDRVIEQPPASADTAVTPEPLPQSKQAEFPFGTIQEKYERHADLVQNPTFTGVLKKAFIRLGGGLGTVWGTTGGKVAMILTAVVLVAGIGSLIYTYRHQIYTFLIQFKAYVLGGDKDAS